MNPAMVAFENMEETFEGEAELLGLKMMMKCSDD